MCFFYLNVTHAEYFFLFLFLCSPFGSTNFNALRPVGSPSLSSPPPLPDPGFPLGSAKPPLRLFWLAVLGKCSVLKNYSEPASPDCGAMWDALQSAESSSHSGGRAEI